MSCLDILAGHRRDVLAKEHTKPSSGDFVAYVCCICPVWLRGDDTLKVMVGWDTGSPRVCDFLGPCAANLSNYHVLSLTDGPWTAGSSGSTIEQTPHDLVLCRRCPTSRCAASNGNVIDLCFGTCATRCAQYLMASPSRYRAPP
jgi:hypothetical protein